MRYMCGVIQMRSSDEVKRSEVKWFTTCCFWCVCANFADFELDNSKYHAPSHFRHWTSGYVALKSGLFSLFDSDVLQL